MARHIFLALFVAISLYTLALLAYPQSQPSNYLQPSDAETPPLQPEHPHHTTSEPTLGPDKEGKYTITSPNHKSEHPKLTLQFIPYGASITNFFITTHIPSTSTYQKSQKQTLDIVAGYDNASYYATDPIHPHFGGIVGRYANRIRNGTFTLPETGEKVQVQKNEHGGLNMLHGGANGWDYRDWKVVKQTRSKIVFGLVDEGGSGEGMGFQGKVGSFVTYTVGDGCWDIKITAKSEEKLTPIMLSSHTYWNLNGFLPLAPKTTALNHTLHLPFAGTRVGTNTILIPTGEIIENQRGKVNDFWSTKGKEVGFSLADKDLIGNCGIGCAGYDTCYINSLRTPTQQASWLNHPIATMASKQSGVSLKIYTDQDALQVYNCAGQDGTTPLKKTQRWKGKGKGGVINKYDCVVLEVQDWIDGINHPEWGRGKKQFFGPGEDGGGEKYELSARYVFGVDGGK